ISIDKFWKESKPSNICVGMHYPIGRRQITAYMLLREITMICSLYVQITVIFIIYRSAIVKTLKS
ncbi:MAG: hypothetical protein ACJ71A_11705, partial [Nitrososphaeraceae archaeon]